MTVLDFTFERRLKLVARDNFAEGYKEGLKESQGEYFISVICKMLRRGHSIDTIAEALEEPIEMIQPIYDIAMKYAPDCEVEKVLEELIKKKASNYADQLNIES